jgi:hypothetical protein
MADYLLVRLVKHPARKTSKPRTDTVIHGQCEKDFPHIGTKGRSKGELLCAQKQIGEAYSRQILNTGVVTCYRCLDVITKHKLVQGKISG